jgi:putative oxidoreductase
MLLTPEFQATWSPRVRGLLRIVSAYLFLLHGSAKLLHVPHIEMFDNLAPLSLFGFAGMLELLGGAMLIAGWQTRVVAFVLSGEMAVAYFMAHASQGYAWAPLLNQGESAVLFCFVFLYLSVAGGGAWGIDPVGREP